jgi:CheY-like chemotaxis protein
MNTDPDTSIQPLAGSRVLLEAQAARYTHASMSTVLIFEEDDLIRELLEDWLMEAGFRVREADRKQPPALTSEGDQVASDQVALSNQVALIIVDICQPRQGGAEIIRAQQRAYPDAPIIAISGRFRSGLAGSVECARELGVRQVLPKPFTREDLLDAVRSVVSAPGDR